MEKEIQFINPLSSRTNIKHAKANAKTLIKEGEVYIFLTSEFLLNFYDGIELESVENSTISLKNNGLAFLKTIFHELGHAQSLIVDGEKNLYFEFQDDKNYNLKKLWLILRDEFIAEQNVAMLNQIFSTKDNISWYGSLDDEIEEENFLTYIEEISKENLLSQRMCLYYLHIYYLQPIFQKVGYINKSIECGYIDSNSLSPNILSILEMDIQNNISAPDSFYSLIAELWDKLHIDNFCKK